jgi:hypothetical protein
VADEDQGCAVGTGGRRPQDTGDLAHGEVAFADAVGAGITGEEKRK